MSLKIVSVFGSSAPTPGSKSYRQAQHIGRLLAEAGYAVATGGYSGTMAAVSQGAALAGGHVIGVTSTQIERFRPLAPNQWVGEEIRYATLRERVLHLVTENCAMIVLPGGIGTLSEMTLAWSFLQVGELRPRPLILVGKKWRAMIDLFFEPMYIQQRHLDLLQFADTVETAVSYL